MITFKRVSIALSVAALLAGCSSGVKLDENSAAANGGANTSWRCQRCGWCGPDRFANRRRWWSQGCGAVWFTLTLTALWSSPMPRSGGAPTRVHQG